MFVFDDVPALSLWLNINNIIDINIFYSIWNPPLTPTEAYPMNFKPQHVQLPKNCFELSAD